MKDMTWFRFSCVCLCHGWGMQPAGRRSLLFSAVVPRGAWDRCPVQLPPFCASQISRGPKAHILPLCWADHLLTGRFFPVFHLTLFYSHQEDPRLFALHRTREVTGPSLQFIAEDTEVPRGRAAWEHAVWVRTDPRGQVSGPDPFPPCGLSPALPGLGLIVCSGEWGAAGYSDVGISLIPSLLKSNGAFNL